MTQVRHLAPPEWRAHALMVSDLSAGALLIALAIPRGPARHHDGGWDKYLIW